jgi:hypothetical protein
MKEPNMLEFKLLMKNIKKNNNIIERRNKTRQEMRQRKKEREKHLEEVLKRNELNENIRKNEYCKRQMSRDLKDVQKRYNILKPQYDENDLYYNNKDITNKIIGKKIKVFSNNRTQHLNEIKNNFYKKNENLKIDQNNNNFIENLNKIDNEIKNIEKNNKTNAFSKTNKFNSNNNNIRTFKKRNTNVNLNRNKLNNNSNNDKNLEIIGKKYNFNMDKKIDEKKVNNLCFDGAFLVNLQLPMVNKQNPFNKAPK